MSAAAILALLFIGDSIGAPGDAGHMLHLHTSVALTGYAVLVARVAWRFARGHPSPSPRQRRAGYALGRALHIGLLLALAAMLASGPLLAWSGGLPLDLWNWRVPAPFEASPGLFAAASRVHAVAATCLGWGILLHILAVAKHVAVDRDGGFERILVPTTIDGAGTG